MENRSNQPAGRSRRRRVMRNRAILVIAVAALVCALGAAGAVAFLIDNTAPVKNAFTPSKVECEVKEPDWTDDVSVEKKNVSVTNTSNIPAYIRVALVANYADADGNLSPVNPAYTLIWNENDWYLAADGYYYCKAAVAPGDDTPVLIRSCSAEGVPAGYHFELQVIASAIQSAPFDAVSEAWGAANVSGLVK